MALDFDEAFTRLIGNEGGYVNDPHDPGGETKYGISKRQYPDLDIPNLTLDQAKAIYKRDFWDAGNMDMLDPALAFQAFDFAVNSGIQTALRKLQVAVGVADDGHIGLITMAAIARFRPGSVILLYAAERIDFWRKLTNWQTFGSGWMARAAKDLRFAAHDLEEE